LHRKRQPACRSDVADNDIDVFGLEGGGITFIHRLNFLFCLFVIIFPDLNAEKKRVSGEVRNINQRQFRSPQKFILVYNDESGTHVELL
jgi:hypothetical protein